MKILFITQVFYPDTVSTSQHLSDLAFFLQEKGNTINVITSRYNYENKAVYYEKNQIIHGVKINRINQTSFGKNKILFRFIDFFVFNVNMTLRLLFLKKSNYDLVIGTTVPPLLSYIGVLISRLKKIPFYYWVMDLQPELSIKSGLIRKDSFLAKLFTYCGNYSIKYSSKIISLDRFMTTYLLSRGADPMQIYTIPVWPVIDKIYSNKRLDNPFRQINNFGEKIVIMYSGNHAFVHPLNTILHCAKEFNSDNRFLFVFIGGGVRKKDVSIFKKIHNLENIIQLPFQPRENIHLSLGSSDFQVVILGEGQVGFTHPNKIYGALYLGKPVIYIGPKESHISDILKTLDGNISVLHGEHQILKTKLLNYIKLPEEEKINIGKNNLKFATDNLSPYSLKNKLSQIILDNNDFNDSN